MEVLAKLLGSTAPSISLLTYFYLKDSKRPEPLRLILKVFICGGLVVFPLLVIQQLLSPLNNGIFIESFLLSGLLEEFIKWFLMFYLIYHHVEFDEFFDGIVYAVAIAAGFATVENLFYIFLTKGSDLFAIIWSRALLPVSGHILFGVTMGYYFAKTKENPKRIYLLLSLFLPTLFHGLFNLLSSYATELSMLMVIAYMSFLWWFSITKMNIGMKKN